MLALVTVIGGRIIPAFTANDLKASGSKETVRAWPMTAGAAIGIMIAVAAVDLVWPNSILAAVLAGSAALIQAIRLAQWRTAAIRSTPILWILHVSYAWLPVGLGMKCAALLGGYAPSAFWLHALTLGVLAAMIMSVMTRASLGHTGRPIVAAPTTIVAYVLLLSSALVRVFGLTAGISYPLVILFSASLFTAAFGCFLWVYVPILTCARADGKPG